MHLDLITVDVLKNYNFDLWRKAYATHSKCVVRKELWVRVPPDRLIWGTGGNGDTHCVQGAAHREVYASSTLAFPIT